MHHNATLQTIGLYGRWNTDYRVIRTISPLLFRSQEGYFILMSVIRVVSSFWNWSSAGPDSVMQWVWQNSHLFPKTADLFRLPLAPSTRCDMELTRSVTLNYSPWIQPIYGSAVLTRSAPVCNSRVSKSDPYLGSLCWVLETDSVTRTPRHAAWSGLSHILESHYRWVCNNDGVIIGKGNRRNWETSFNVTIWAMNLTWNHPVRNP